MHYITTILILILILLILYYSVEGMVINSFDWRHPDFDKKASTDELQVERMDSFPTGYSSVPVLDAMPINLEDVKKMFETNVNSDKYNNILDKLNSIEDELLLAKSKYSCTNIDGLDSDNPLDNQEFTCPDNKVLTVGLLDRKCSTKGCSTDECCVDRPDTSDLRYYYANNKCLLVQSTETGDQYYPFEELDRCEREHTKCSNLEQYDVDDGVDGRDDNLCVGDDIRLDDNKICDATDLREAIRGGDQATIERHDCHQKCCS